MKSIIGKPGRSIPAWHSPLDYWEKRTHCYGKRAVINIAHQEKEIDRISQFQMEQCFPIMQAALRGDEKTILDFGCGYGRFTAGLAALIHGKAIGVDPTKSLLALAAISPNTEYRLMDAGQIPVPDHSVEVVWICLVLGGILSEETLQQTVEEINRVITQDGLLVLVENTSEKSSSDYWIYRPVVDYQELFRLFHLSHCLDYEDQGERISVLRGRRQS